MRLRIVRCLSAADFDSVWAEGRGFIKMLTFSTGGLAQDARYNDLANLPFQQNYPIKEMARQRKSAEVSHREGFFRRLTMLHS